MSTKRIFFESRRPDGAFVVDPLPVSLSVLRARPCRRAARTTQLVLAARVGEVRDRLAVRRPRRAALVNAGGVGQVARVALLGRDGDDLAAELEHRRARRSARRRTSRTYLAPLTKRGRASTSSVATPTLSRFGSVSPGVEQVQITGLLEDERLPSVAMSSTGKSVNLRELLEFLRRGVVGRTRCTRRCDRSGSRACCRPSSGRGRCSGPSAAGSRRRRGLDVVNPDAADACRRDSASTGRSRREPACKRCTGRRASTRPRSPRGSATASACRRSSGTVKSCCAGCAKTCRGDVKSTLLPSGVKPRTMSGAGC